MKLLFNIEFLLIFGFDSTNSTLCVNIFPPPRKSKLLHEIFPSSDNFTFQVLLPPTTKHYIESRTFSLVAAASTKLFVVPK